MKEKTKPLNSVVEILVVEDSRTQAGQLEYFLERQGYSVSVVTNGVQALALMAKSLPTLVISDILMPEIDGFELCRRMKSDERLKQIPVILLTSLADPQDVIKGLECGASNFITKPYDKAYLLSRIRYILANLDLRRTSQSQLGVEIFFADQKHFITADRLQILDLLLSTYETAVRKNKELASSQQQLKELNEVLEQKVSERTSALAAEVKEREQAQEALRETAEALQALIQASPLAIIALDLKNCVKSWNPAAERIFGWRTAEVLGLSNPVISDLEWSSFRKECEAAFNERGFALLEMQRQKSNGSTVDVSISAVPLTDRRGFVNGIMAVVADITERKHLEEQLRQSQKMEAIGQLAGGIAHDFNNLLTTIIGHSQLVMRQLGPEDPLLSQLEEIEKAGRRAAALTSQLLAFSRKQVLQPRVLSLNDVLANTRELVSRLIGEHIEVVTFFSSDLYHVKADPSQIEQVLMNLAVNARDAMPRGGRLTIETSNIYLDREYTREHIDVEEGHYVMVAVSDTGCGMDKETQERIFEPFFTTKGEGKGTGLGLATVYGIVRQSGGDIWVYSEQGKGTTFKIYLPRSTETYQPPEAEPRTIQSYTGSETILLVEDDDLLRKLARQILELNGYNVLEAASGTEALSICKRHDLIDLMITDVIMPRLNGHELAEQVKPLHPEMRVLYISGYTGNALDQFNECATNTPLLQKPFNPSGLARAVREVLDHSSGQVTSRANQA